MTREYICTTHGCISLSSKDSPNALWCHPCSMRRWRAIEANGGADVLHLSAYERDSLTGYLLAPPRRRT
jgi:hypothetical protein